MYDLLLIVFSISINGSDDEDVPPATLENVDVRGFILFVYNRFAHTMLKNLNPHERCCYWLKNDI